MKSIVYLLTMLCGLWTIGCASVLPPVNLDPAFWKNPNSTIAVAMTAIPRAQATKMGSQGLLDMVVNEAMGSDLDAHLNSLDVSRFKQMQQTFRERLVDNGYAVKDVQAPISIDTLADFDGPSGNVVYTSQDFRPFKQQLGADKLLLLEVTYIGTKRSYYGFVPLGAPEVHCSGRGTLIDLSNNRVLWHDSELQTSSIPDPWDAAPSFPNLTHTLGGAMETVQRNISDSFFAVAPKGPRDASEPVKVARVKAPAAPPDSFGDAFGFVFGTSKVDAAAECQKAGHQWSENEGVYHCSGAPSTEIPGAATQLEFGARGLTSVEIVIAPPNDAVGWSGTFRKTESALTAFYDKPKERSFVVPDDCKTEETFLACVADGKVNGSASWYLDENHSATLTIVAKPLPALSILRVRIGRALPKS